MNVVDAIVFFAPMVVLGIFIGFIVSLIAVIVYYERRRQRRIQLHLPLDRDNPPSGFPVEPPPASPNASSDSDS